MELKVLKMNVKSCFYMQLRNKIYRQWGTEIYLALQENRREMEKGKMGDQIGGGGNQKQTLEEENGLKERIEQMGSRIEWREM